MTQKTNLFSFIVVICLLGLLYAFYLSSTPSTFSSQVTREMVSTSWIITTATKDITINYTNYLDKHWRVLILIDSNDTLVYRNHNIILITRASLLEQGFKLGNVEKSQINVRNLGLLYAMQNGAQIIYEVDAGGDKPAFPSIKSLPSYGLVTYGSKLFNPHLHFRQTSSNRSFYYLLHQIHPCVQHFITNRIDIINLMWGTNSSEHFSESINVRSPPIFLANGTLTPFLLKNTLFRYDAIWSMFVPNVTPLVIRHVYRNLMMQRFLKEIGGTLGFYPPNSVNPKEYVPDDSVFNETLGIHVKSNIILMVKFLSNWTCEPTLTVFECAIQLVKDLVKHNSLLEPVNINLMKAWIRDLVSLGYTEPMRSPLTFLPNGVLHKLESKVIYSPASATLSYPEQLKVVSKLCPSNNSLQASTPNAKFENILLLVIFNFPFYNNIPTIQNLYGHTFSQIIYCGKNLTDYEIKAKKFDFRGSFIEANIGNGAYFYRCLSQVMKMNYNVSGYLLIGDDVLINTWNIKHYPLDKIWISTGGNVSLNKPKPEWVHWDAFYGRKAVHAMLQDLLTNNPDKYKQFRKTLAHNSNSTDRVFYGGSDIVYIPENLKEDAVFYLELFSKHGIFLEITVHSVVLGMQRRENIFTLPNGYMWSGAQKANFPKFYKPTEFFIHPFKFGPQLKTKKGLEFLCTQYIPYLINGTR